MKVVVANKRAHFDYQILETFEAGIKLIGCEVKSVRMGRVSLNESFARVREGEAILLNAHISPYPQGVPAGYDPRAARKLLLKKKEIEYLDVKTQEGLMIVPIKIYLARNLIKVEIALARAKKKYDKREKIKEQTIKREIERKMKSG